MSVQEARRERQQQGTTIDRFEFKEEKRSIPLTHSGFIEECTNKPGKSAFFLSVWFTNGQYKGCLLDREAGEKAFFDVGELLDVLGRIEQHLEQGTFEWLPATDNKRGGFGT